MRFRKITFIALFFVLPINFSFAQTVLPKLTFVSVYGNFSIALPENPNLTRGLRNEAAPDKGAGMIYAWESENVVYTALYLDPLENTENLTINEQAKSFEENNKNVRETIRKYEGTIISEKPLALSGYMNIEIQAKIGAGKMIARNLQIKRRSYSIQAILRDLNDEAKALKILDSFKLIDGRAIFLKKIAENAPPPRPQRPVVKTPKSDVETANLKGKVKTVIEESEDLTGDSFQQGRLFSAEYFYNASGFQTKEISYDSRGNPFQIAVYGFINKALICKFGSIRYPYNPPAPLSAKPADRRYDLKFNYIFDEQGRVKEAKYYRNNEELSSRTLTIYEENKVETQNFNAQGELVSKTFQTFDEKGNLIESVFQALKPKVLEYKTVYKYESFDEKGNWTKRILSEWRTKDGQSFYEPIKFHYRTFVYYS
jgi:hypothetical protein